MRFALSTAGLATVALAGTATGATVNMTHDMDRWAGEHAWQVTSSGGATVASMYYSGGFYYNGVSSVSIVTSPASADYFGTAFGTLDLAAGTYQVAMQDTYGDGWAWNSFVGGLAIGSGSGTVAAGTSTGSFSFTVVPAPGAMALLGLAGLAARRRRRD